MEMKELYEKMLKKCKEDSSFKKRLLDNAKEAIKSEFGVDFGPDVEVEVYQSTEKHKHFVIPLDE